MGYEAAGGRPAAPLKAQPTLKLRLTKHGAWGMGHGKWYSVFGEVMP